MTAEAIPPPDPAPSPDLGRSTEVALTAAPEGTRAAAEARLAAVAPGYLERVRTAAHRLAHRSTAEVGVVAALAGVEDTAPLDLEAPTLSRLRTGRLIKVTVKKLTSWYMRYLTQQVAAFTAAVTTFAATLVERTDRLDQRTTALEADLQRLHRRLDGPGPGPDRQPVPVAEPGRDGQAAGPGPDTGDTPG